MSDDHLEHIEHFLEAYREDDDEELIANPIAYHWLTVGNLRAAAAELKRLRNELAAAYGDEGADPQGGWVLWDAEGHWVSTTTSETEDPWVTMNVTEKERLALVTNGYFIDKLDPDGWRVLDALHGGANVAGVRDQWLVGKVELAKPGGMTPAELLAWRAKR